MGCSCTAEKRGKSQGGFSIPGEETLLFTYQNTGVNKRHFHINKNHDVFIKNQLVGHTLGHK